MRTFAVYILVVALIGESLCGRLRRQVPDAGTLGDAPEGVGADMDGAPEGVATQANTQADGLNAALNMMLNDVNNQKAMGEPADPQKVETIMKMTLIIGLVGEELSEVNKDGIADLLTAPSAGDSTA